MLLATCCAATVPTLPVVVHVQLSPVVAATATACAQLLPLLVVLALLTTVHVQLERHCRRRSRAAMPIATRDVAAVVAALVRLHLYCKIKRWIWCA